MSEDIFVKISLKKGQLITDYGNTTKAITDKNKDLTASMGAVKGASSKLENAIKGLVAGFGALYVVGKITSLFKDSIQAFDQEAEAAAKVAQTIRSTGMAAGWTYKELKDMAAEFQRVTRYGDETVMTGQALLLTFKKISKEQFPEATETMLDLATAMGTDVKSAALQLGKALEDPATQMSVLRRSGISFSTEQIAMAKRMQATGDIAGAQALVLKEVRSQFGGLARAAAEAGAGPLIKFRNRIDDIKELLGKALMPVLTETIAAMETMWVPTNADVMLRKFVEMASYIRIATGAALDFTNTIGAAVKFVGAMAERNQALQKGLLATFSKQKATESEAATKRAEQLEAESLALLKNTGQMMANSSGREQWVKQTLRQMDANEKLLNAAKKRTITDDPEDPAGSEQKGEKVFDVIGAKLEAERAAALETEKVYDAVGVKRQWLESIEAEAAKREAERLATKNNLIMQSAHMYISAFGQMAGANSAWAATYKTVAAAEAFVSTWLTAQKMAEQAAKLPPPAGLILPPIIYGAAVAKGLAGVANIKKAATGIDYVTTGPEFIRVGDNPGGRERVSVTPLSSRNVNGPRGGGGAFSPTIVVNNSTDPERTAQAVKNTVWEQYKEYARMGRRIEDYRL